MSRFFVLVVIGLFSLYAEAQNNFSISVELAPIYSNRFLFAKSDTIPEIHFNSNKYIEGRNDADGFESGFKSGLTGYYNIGNKIEIIVGLSFLYQKVSQSALMPEAIYTIQNERIMVFGTKFYPTKQSEYGYLTIPVGIHYSILNFDALKISISCGVASSFLLSNSNIGIGNLNLSEDELNVKKRAFEVGSGVCFGYSLNKKTELFFRPNFNMFITSNIVEYSNIKQHNYYYCLGAGIKYTL